MTKLQLKLIKRAIIIRMSEGETFQEASSHYPKLSPSELAEIEAEIFDSDNRG